MVNPFYRTPTIQDVLSQGDIFFDLPVPQFTFSPFFRLESIGENNYRTEQTDEIQAGMRMLADIEMKRGIVITQSCDALRAESIMVAPLLPYGRGSKSVKEQWSYINSLATSLHEPTRMYLPDDDSRGLPRQIMDLGGVFTFPREEMELFIKQGKRKATLETEGLRYLQFRLAVMFWRVARDDYFWPSYNDLTMKLTGLESGKNKLEADVQNKERECANLKEKIRHAEDNATREKFEKTLQTRMEEIEDIRADLGDAEHEIDQTKQALAIKRQSGPSE